MWDRHVIGVDMVGRFGTGNLWSEVRHDLMSIEIKIYPALRAAALFAPENFTIELAGRIEVMDGKRKMEKVVHASNSKHNHFSDHGRRARTD